MSPKMRQLLPRLLLVLGGTALGIVLLVLLLRSVRADQLAGDLAHVDRTYLLIAIVPFLMNLLFKVPRWALLYGDHAPDYDSLFGALNVGYAVNALLPARLGEIVRAYWIRDRAGIPMVRTLSTIALERVADGLTLVVMLVVAAPTVALPSTLIRPALSIGVLFVLALIAMIALAFGATRENHPVWRLVRRLEASRIHLAGQLLRQIISGVGALSSPRAGLLLLLYTVVIWGSNSVLVWLVVRALHIDVPIMAGVLLVAVLNLGMTVPSSPGYVGVFDYLMVLVLGLYGVAHTPALAAALIFHAIAFGPVTIIGLIYIARFGAEATLQIIRASATRSDTPA